MRQISIVQARSNRGVFACWVYKQGLRRGEEGGGEHGRREPSTSLGHRFFGEVLVILAGHRNFTTVECHVGEEVVGEEDASACNNRLPTQI